MRSRCVLSVGPATFSEAQVREGRGHYTHPRARRDRFINCENHRCENILVGRFVPWLLPHTASFRYTLPPTYRHLPSGKDYPLPPTYAEELHGIPGFIVKISYAVVVNLALLREASSLWRGVSKCVCYGVNSPLGRDADYVALPRTRSVRVPFRYSPRTRPLIPGPFPSIPEKTPTRPRTLFVYQMRSSRDDAPVIKVHVGTVHLAHASHPMSLT